MALRVIAALVAVLVYANALRNPFIYDDYHTVVRNESIVPPVSWRAVVLHDVKRPIVNASYALDRALWGASSTGFHATSIALHAVNVLLLFALAAALIGDGLPAFAAASLFAVHPMMSEAVGYISGRSELLCALFVLAALLCGLRWIRGGPAWWAALIVLCWVAAMLSKETAAVVPLLLVFADWLFSPDAIGTRRRIRTFHAPLFALAAAAAALRLVVLLRVEGAGALAVRMPLVLVAIEVVVRYLRLLVVPMNQTLFHAVAPIKGAGDPRAIFAIAVLTAVGLLAWRLLRSDRTAAFGLIAFLLLLTPAAVLTALNVGEPMAEHRVYVASTGFFLALGAAAGRFTQWAQAKTARPQVWMATVVAMLLISFAGETLQRNVVWSDPVDLWQESVALAPNHPRPRLLLGEALEDGGRRSEAVEQYETAVRLQPTDPEAQLKLGICLAGLGRFDEARAVLKETLRLDPNNAPAQRAIALLDQMKPVT